MTEGTLRGRVTVIVRCGHPERILNMCAQRGIAISASRAQGEDTIELALSNSGYRLLKALQADSGFELSVVKKRGLPGLVSKLRARCWFGLSLLLCLLALWTLSLFAWDFEVYGNESVSTAEILAVMEELGVGPGVCRLTVDDEALANAMLLRITKLSWFAVNFNGSRAAVLVREESPKPEIEEDDVPAMVCASETGIIERIYVWNGKAAVKPGDAVTEGQVLVTGAMDSISSGVRYEHAAAEVWARTRHVLSESAELEYTGKKYSGNDYRKSALIIGRKRINLYNSGGNPEGFYDKISTERNASLLGAALPLRLETQYLRGYEAVNVNADRKETETLLRERLQERLRSRIGENGEIINEKYFLSSKGGVLTVTLCAECSQLIGAEREMRAEDFIVNTEETTQDITQNGE